MKRFFWPKIKRTKHAIVVSMFIVAIFGLMQAMETRSATTSQVDLSVEVASALDISCPNPSAFGTLTPGTPETTTATCTVTTSAANGYELQVKRDDADTTLDLSINASTNIADLTAWNGSNNAAAWTDGVTTGLGFRVVASGTDEGHNSTWWGTDGSSLYAGLPSSYVTILDDTTYSAAATDTVIEFKVDVSASQASGTYTGTATFQGTVNP